MIRLFILLGRLNRIEGWVLIPVEWLNYIRVYPTCQTKESELHCCCQDAWGLINGKWTEDGRIQITPLISPQPCWWMHRLMCGVRFQSGSDALACSYKPEISTGHQQPTRMGICGCSLQALLTTFYKKRSCSSKSPVVLVNEQGLTFSLWAQARYR